MGGYRGDRERMAGEGRRANRSVTRGGRRRDGQWAWLVAAGLLCSACAAMGPDVAQERDEAAQEQAGQGQGAVPARPVETRRPASGEREGVGYLSPLATAAYFPLKALPCSLTTVGAVVGFLFTFDAKMVRDAVAQGCGGDWIITPGMLEGREGFRSVGRVEDLQGPVPPPSPAPPPAGLVPPIREPGPAGEPGF